MGTQITDKERYLTLWERLNEGIKKNYDGSLRKFAQDYFDRAPDNQYERDTEKEFKPFYEHLKKLKQRKDAFNSVAPSTIEKMEKYCLFLEKERLYFHSMLDDEYILTD